MSTPTIHDVDNYGRHSVMPGRHTVAEHRAVECVLDMLATHGRDLGATQTDAGRRVRA